MHSNIQNANPSAHLTSLEPVPLEQVLRVAELAQLELTLDEQQEMLRDLNAILGHVAQLNELDTRDVPAMTQVKEIMSAASGSGGGNANPNSEDGAAPSGNVLRDDTPRASLDRSRAMAAAPETDGTYFKVPKVIER
ncbi:MAG TPA: Asp-tRNA(Asn)/Glu-tRNA(Gln) amidotransferase subunit GatC [Acidobacteriaceae bacterium]|nr:Asp-tRNA(Asn)/Glu-tRNA(Gln) amidotransferase subunit GatC [Terriglobia bacterium]HVC90914.1 Asp-tRNA(Asn)/Glu-tRNA(Gln) amidotransferase subunit GatC [Acidobacteriaceae bacterium]